MLPAVRSFTLRCSYDIVQARQYARETAREMGFSLTDQTRFATAVSEIARRVLDDGDEGSLRFALVASGSRRGLECACLGSPWRYDAAAPASRGLLSGVERLVDDFELAPGGKEGLLVLRKWLPLARPASFQAPHSV